MASAVKTIVATGVSSGLVGHFFSYETWFFLLLDFNTPQGLEALKQLLQAPQTYRVVTGARNTSGLEQSLKDISFESANKVDVLPLDLADLKGTKTFAEDALRKIGDAKIDYLFLNAAITNPAVANPRGYRWCESAVVNHVCK